MSRKVSIIQGKGDWEAVPPTGASDHDLMHIINDILNGGGVVDLEGGDYLVEESDTPGMSVKVAAGTIYVENSSWTPNSFEPKLYRVVMDAEDDTLTISSNSSGSTRIDLICQEIDKVTAPNDDADNVCPLTVVEGTPGAGIPATPNDMEVVARVTVVDGETSITNSEIADVRRQVYARPSVTNAGFKVLSDGATVTVDSEGGTYNKFYVEITADRDITFANVPVGLPIMLEIEQGSGAPNIPNFTDSILWTPDGDEPDYSTDSGVIDTLVFIKQESGDYIGAPAAMGAQ